MENIIVITNESNKKYILRELSQNKLLYNIKFYTFLDLKKKLFFDYDNKTIEYIMNKFSVPFDIAQEYLDNMYFLKDLEDDKVRFLISLKEELEGSNLLIKSTNFKEYLKNKRIVVYGYESFTKEEKLILEEMGEKWEEVNPLKEIYTPQVYEAKNKEQELEFVLNRISALIYDKVDIKRIKIIINDEDRNDIKRYFDLYSIPLNIESKSSYYSTMVAQEFLRNYEIKSIEENILDLMEKYSDLNDLITIINKSVLVEEKSLKKEFIINDLKKAKIKEDLYDEAVTVGSITDVFRDTDYVFLLGFNLNYYPKVRKDEEFLSDKVKDQLGLDTSDDKNKKIKKEIITRLKKIKNLVITYKLQGNNMVYYPSLLIEEMGLKVEECLVDEHISYSKINSALKYAQSLDLLYKYNSISPNLSLYSHNMDIKYREYNNEFKGIDNILFREALKHELTLAYTSMEMYNECAFKYYLSKIMKIDIYEENFKAIMGTIVHHILELALKRDINIPIEIMNFVKEKEYQLGVREYFYLEKLGEELEKVVEVLKEQARHSKLSKYLFEEELYVYLDQEDFKVTFEGLIDKVMYQDWNGKEVLAVVDYKTGLKKVSLDNLEYGLDLQLPLYLYLLKKSERFKDALIGGFYIQKVLSNVPTIMDKSREEKMQLQGYSNSDPKILEMLDQEYMDGKIIKDLKFKNDGTMSKKAKVLSNGEMEDLANLMEEKIIKCVKSILKGYFKINPKVIKGVNNACLYCKFKDICFKEPKDEVILGGEENESN